MIAWLLRRSRLKPVRLRSSFDEALRGVYTSSVRTLVVDAKVLSWFQPEPPLTRCQRARCRWQSFVLEVRQRARCLVRGHDGED